MNTLRSLVGTSLDVAMPVLFDWTLKSGVLLIVAGIAALALWRVSAAKRYLVWLFALIAVAVLPFMSFLGPEWRVLPGQTAPGLFRASAPSTALGSSEAGVQASWFPKQGDQSRSSEALNSSPLRTWLALAWGIVCAFLLARLVFAQLLLRRISERCALVTVGRFAEVVEEVRRQLGIRCTVEVLLDSQGAIPLVWGVFKRRLLLPAEAEQWDDSQLRSYLLHELAHIKRWDTAAQWIGQVVFAVHWFNPLLWLAVWRLREERERACDDAVLTNGVSPSDYTEHLLYIVKRLSSTRLAYACGLAMVRPRRLEGRLLAVSDKLNRSGATQSFVLSALAFGLSVIIPLAMLRAADGAKAVIQPGKPVVVHFTSGEGRETGRQQFGVNVPKSGRYALLFENANGSFGGKWCTWDAIVLRQSGTETEIWSVGNDDVGARGDYSPKAFAEFAKKGTKGASGKFIVGQTKPKEFVGEINDFDLTKSEVHFDITAEQLAAKPILTVSTLYSTHEGADGFKMRISVVPSTEPVK